MATASAKEVAPGRAMESVSVTMSTVETLVTSAMKDIIRASRMTPSCSARPVTSLALATVQEVNFHWSMIYEQCSDWLILQEDPRPVLCVPRDTS